MGRGYDAQPILSEFSSLSSVQFDFEKIFEKMVETNSRVTNTLNGLMKDINNFHKDSSFSSLNILIALYEYWIPKGNIQRINRSVILSKGHAAPALYALLAEKGLISKEELNYFAYPNSRLQSHPEGNKVPGILFSTGSLGQGLSVANGLAYASKLNQEKREFAVILGDGELDEGQIWESIATSYNLKIDNVIAIIDRNGFQLSGHTEEIKIKEPIKKKFESFGWYTIEINNNLNELILSLELMSEIKGLPKAIIVKSMQSFR